VLDAGAAGVQVANVETAEQARAIVRAVKYAPLGERGLGLTAAHSDFRTPKASEYLPFRNKDTLIIAQVETVKGVENCEEIAAVEGIDVLAVGNNDLTFSMGIHGQLEHPRFIEALERVAAAFKKHGKMGKCHPHHDEQIAQFSAMGYQLMMANSDVSQMRSALRKTFDNLRKHLPKRG
jgi:2-dehydro-3-deoxyglucarate aldolase/4-hydroxy-2-oxoheptanedioate aldolase